MSLTQDLLQEMRKNPRVIGVKNSSMPTQDIEIWEEVGGPEFVVMNGPDEQFVSGLAMGATGGIGGTYAVMPELFLKIYELYQNGDVKRAAQVQHKACHIIYTMCGAHGNLYAVMKEILKRRGVNVGTVRKPLPALTESDMTVVESAMEQIDAAIAEFC